MSNDDGTNNHEEPCLVFQFRGQPVPVTKSAAVTMEQAQRTLQSNPFRSWVHRMETSISDPPSSVGQQEPHQRQLQIQAVELQSVDLFGARGVGFCKIKSQCTLQIVKQTTNNSN